jgi:hypothetical protein
MEVVRSESGVRSEKIAAPVATVIARTKRFQVWFIRVCSSILLWTCLVQLLTVGELWHPSFMANTTVSIVKPPHHPPPLLPLSKSYSLSFFFLKKKLLIFWLWIYKGIYFLLLNFWKKFGITGVSHVEILNSYWGQSDIAVCDLGL